MLGFPAFRDLVSFFLGVNNKAAPDNDDDDDDDDDVAMGGVGSVVFQILNFFLLFSFFFLSSLKKINFIKNLPSAPLPVFIQKKQNFLQPNLHNLRVTLFFLAFIVAKVREHF